MPVARARLIAVSATVPNASDIAHWLAVPPEGLRIYGEEMRPCKLRRGGGRGAAADVARVSPCTRRAHTTHNPHVRPQPELLKTLEYHQKPATRQKPQRKTNRPRRTVVRSFAPAKNDFLFERRLNDYLPAIIQEHSRGRPALVFCASRKGASDAAAHLAKLKTGSAVMMELPAEAF